MIYLKHIFLKHIFLLILLAFPCTILADELVPDDFAWGMTLKVPGDSAFYTISIPAAVYQDVSRNDLGDIRIFNGQKETVPHTIKTPDSTRATAHPPVSLPFFPLYGTDRQASGENISLRVNTARDGTIIDVRTEKGKGPDSRLQAVLLDLTSIDRAPAGLVLEWKEETPDFVMNVSVDGSNDLADWETLVSRAALAEQHFSGHALFKNRIDLREPDRSGNYLRINWPGAAPAPELDRITAFFPETAVGPNRQYLRIDGKAVTAKDAIIYEFETGGAFPVDRVNVVLPEKNSLIRGVLRSRPDQQSEWRWRGNLLVYQLHLEGATLSNETVSLSTPIIDRYWRIEATPGSGGLGKKTPMLEIGWIPHHLVFLARGEGPFTMAFGSTATGPADSSVHEVLYGIDDNGKTAMIREATLGERFVLGGPSKLEKPRLAISWKTWILWTVLVFGVILMAYLAVRLYRQMEMNAPRQKRANGEKDDQNNS